MMQGIKLIFRSKENRVLAFKNADDWDLPSCSVEHVDELRNSTRNLFKKVTGAFPDKDPIPVYRGYDDEYGVSSSYISDWTGIPKTKKGQKADWVDVIDILSSKWGLFARDAFHRLKLINRPKLDLEDLYTISKKALKDGSRHASEGVDKVIDEIVFLMEINKSEAVDNLLQHMDVTKLHADILSAALAVLENYDLPSKARFVEDANIIIQEIDALRPKMKLKDEYGRILSHDVRGDALKYYRKKAVEFGNLLREGKLGPGLHRGGAPIPRRKAN